MTTMPSMTEHPPGRAVNLVQGRPPWQSKWLVLIVAVFSYVIFAILAPFVGLNVAHGFDGSLLMSGGFGGLLVTAIILVTCVALGTVVAGTIRPDAGLFAGAIGLMALSIRGRTMTGVVQDAGGSRGVFLTLALELVLLYAILGVAWFGLLQLRKSGRLKADALRDGLVDEPHPASAGWMTLGTSAVIMANLVIFLAQSQDKKQVLGVVFFGALIGAFIPYWRRGANLSVWYWTAPLVVGLFGYVLAYIEPPQPGIEIGRLGLGGGFLTALANPLPIDYASMGTAGALLGFWMRRKGLQERETLEAGGSTPAQKTST
jgi:hypothetical protein